MERPDKPLLSTKNLLYAVLVLQLATFAVAGAAFAKANAPRPPLAEQVKAYSATQKAMYSDLQKMKEYVK